MKRYLASILLSGCFIAGESRTSFSRVGTVETVRNAKNTEADGVQMATVDFVLRDSNGDPLRGLPVQLSLEGTGYNISDWEPTTDIAGGLRLGMTSYIPGNVGIALFSSQQQIASTTLHFSPAQPDPGSSSVEILPMRQFAADGVDTAVVIVELKTATSSIPYGSIVTLSGASFPIPSQRVNEDGRVIFELKTAMAQTIALSIIVNDNITLESPSPIEFK